MKTLFTFALAGALSLSSLAASAADDLLALSSAQAKFKKINVLLKEGVGEAKVAIYDPSGKKLHQRKVKVSDEQLILPYNLGDMPVGEYKVQISTENENVEYKVTTFEPAPAPEALPLVAFGKTIDEETIGLTVIGLTEPGVKVEIRNESSNKLIFSESIDQEEGFRKNYSLRGVAPKDIYVKVTDSKGRVKNLYF
ncbi:MAG: hypothetical protein B7Z16_15195 [Algoriphagus sp. 32-45-6]|nr:MAG: hypothetical protein B7Z16_15195 [Algoriphagus sp. 32-45-6]